MWYHVVILVQGERFAVVKLDCDDATLRNQFLTPRDEGAAIVVGGRTIDSMQIRQIAIYAAAQRSVRGHHVVENYLKSSVHRIPETDVEVARSGANVTDEFIKAPAGHQRTTAPNKDPAGPWCADESIGLHRPRPRLRSQTRRGPLPACPGTGNDHPR